MGKNKKGNVFALINRLVDAGLFDLNKVWDEHFLDPAAKPGLRMPGIAMVNGPSGLIAVIDLNRAERFKFSSLFGDQAN